MTYGTIVFILILVLLIIITIALLLLIRYLGRRDKGNLRLHVKLGFFEFDIDTSAEKITKKNK